MSGCSPRVLLAGLLLAASPALIRAQSAPAAPPSREYLLLGDVTRGAGEPMLAVDPTDSNNIVVIGMGSLNRLGPEPVTRNLTSAYWKVADSTLPWLAVTHNGGRTWTVGILPILARQTAPDGKPFGRCPDPFAAVTAQGVFLVGCEPRETQPDAQDFYLGGSYLMISKDKGDTWSSHATPVITSWAQARFAPGLKPRFGGVASPWDRPYIKVDDSTGVIYGQAGGGQTDIDQKPGVYRTQSYITASTDGGQTFGTIYAWDSPEYPESGRGAFDVANGILAVAYPARSVAGDPGAHCPCPVFGASRDQGRSFAYHVIPPPPPAPPATGRGFPGARGGGLDLAADPTHPGRFAVMAGDGGRLLVSVTDDAGATWSPWTTAAFVPGTQPTKPWITYSREGVLGLMWRAISPGGGYRIWSAVSRDGGHSFSPAVPVSHQASPPGFPNRDDGMFGDDIQDLVVGKSTLRMVWGDSRSGFLGAWFATVPLSAYAAPAP